MGKRFAVRRPTVNRHWVSMKRIITNALGEDRWAESHIFVIAVERFPTR